MVVLDRPRPRKAESSRISKWHGQGNHICTSIETSAPTWTTAWKWDSYFIYNVPDVKKDSAYYETFPWPLLSSIVASDYFPISGPSNALCYKEMMRLVIWEPSYTLSLIYVSCQPEIISHYPAITDGQESMQTSVPAEQPKKTLCPVWFWRMVWFIDGSCQQNRIC